MAPGGALAAALGAHVEGGGRGTRRAASLTHLVGVRDPPKLHFDQRGPLMLRLEVLTTRDLVVVPTHLRARATQHREGRARR